MGNVLKIIKCVSNEDNKIMAFDAETNLTPDKVYGSGNNIQEAVINLFEEEKKQEAAKRGKEKLDNFKQELRKLINALGIDSLLGLADTFITNEIMKHIQELTAKEKTINNNITMEDIKKQQI